MFRIAITAVCNLWALFFALCFLPFSLQAQQPPIVYDNAHIEQGKIRWKPYYDASLPQEAVDKWYLPFNTSHRHNLKTIGVVNIFGLRRESYLRGHLHTGLDMVPVQQKRKYVFIYAVANGIVCSIHLAQPHLTVVVKHRLPDGSIMYSAYKHLQCEYVKRGQNVTPSTKIGRLYTRDETEKYGGRYDHLHLEIRKSFDDYGIASWATMSKDELEKRFHNPLIFLKDNLHLQ